MIIKLNSVGCVVDSKNLLTYPEYRDGTYDVDFGIHLEDCTGEWYEHLSEEDTEVVKELLIDTLYKNFVNRKKIDR